MTRLSWPNRRQRGERIARNAFRLITAFSVGLGLTFLGPLVASASASSITPSVEAIQRGWSYVPEYSAAAPTLALGKVVSSAGVPLAGATVIMFPALGNFKAGMVLTPLARTITDSRGHFALRLPSSKEAALAIARSQGALNLHVTAFYPGGSAQWFYSLPKASSPPTSATLVLHATTTVKPSRVQGVKISPNTCTTVGNPVQTQKTPVIVGMKESDASDLANTSFSYTTTASMTLGEGISFNGPFGGFTQNGTTVKTSGLQGSWNSLPSESNNYLEAQAVYEDQQFLCFTAGNYTDDWTLTQHSVGGAAASPGTPSIPTGHCYAYQAKTSAKIDAGTQQTFSAGVKFSAEGYGADFSAQDGWTSQSELIYTMGNTHGHPVCGQHDYPGAPNVVVGAVGVHSTNL
jgi:hypothetical protein